MSVSWTLPSKLPSTVSVVVPVVFVNTYEINRFVYPDVSNQPLTTGDPATVTGVMYSQTFQPGGVTGIYFTPFDAAARAARDLVTGSGSPLSSSRNNGTRSLFSASASRSRFTSSWVSGYGSPFTTSFSVPSCRPATNVSCAW